MQLREYGVSINGCPYLFTSQGVATLPTSASSDWSSDWLLARGFFDWEESPLAWSERMRPLDGGLDCDAQSFKMFDGLATNGPAIGRNLFTWLATRDEEVLISTVLAVAITNGLQPGATYRGQTGPTTITVADGSAMPSGSQVVWLGGEAILCDSRASDVLTINANGRGYYGSYATAHLIDVGSGVYPEVWTEFPWATKRRVILWTIDGTTNVATPMWRGFCNRAPRMLDDLAKFELQCDHMWTRIKDARLGNSVATTYVRGFDPIGVRFRVFVSGLTETATDFGASAHLPRRWYDTFDALLHDFCSNLAHQIRLLAGVTNVGCSAALWNNGYQVSLSADGLVDLTFTISLGEDEYTAVSTAPTGFTRRAIVQIPHAPTAIAVFAQHRTGTSPLAITDTTDLPQTAGGWLPTNYDDSGYSTQIRYALLGDYDADRDLLIEPSSIDLTAPSVTGPTTFLPKDPSAVLTSVPFSPYGFIQSKLRLDLVTSVRSPHWAMALKHCVADTEVISAGIDERDLSFDNLDQLANATSSFFARRNFLFDGTQKFGDVARDNALVSGCGLAIRDSRVSFVPYGVTARSVAPVATIGEDDLVDKATATPLPDGLACAMEIDASTRKITVIDARSVGRYGRSRTVQASMSGQIEQLNAARNPRALASQVLSRVVNNFSRPQWYVSLPVNLSFLDENPVSQGDTIRISESFLPDGAGGRGIGNAASLAALGLAGRAGFVLDRDIDIHAGKVTLHVLLRGAPRGYSPCCRVSSISGDTATMALAYVGSPGSDYAGSNLGGYSGTTNDGGVSRFLPGDRVEILRRDHNAYVRDSLIVLSTDPANQKIRFTTTIPTIPNDWQFNVNGSLWSADVRYNEYTTSGLQSAQKDYAYVGGMAPAVIDGTTDRDHQWGP